MDHVKVCKAHTLTTNLYGKGFLQKYQISYKYSTNKRNTHNKDMVQYALVLEKRLISYVTTTRN